MASAPYLHNGVWFMKWKPDPIGKWKKQRLAKESRPYPASKPPKAPLPEVLKLHAHYAEQEEKARHGFKPAADSPIGRFAQEYLRSYALGHRKSTVRGATLFISDFVKFCDTSGVKDMRLVSRPLCRKFLESLLTNGYAPNSVHVYKGYVATMFGRAVEDGVISANPWARLPLPAPKTEPPPTFWTDDEIRRIIAAGKQPYRDIYTVMANTGIRVSAVLDMRWTWIDWKTGLITVPVESSKNKAAYSVPMTAVARECLDNRRKTEGESGLVFVGVRRRNRINYDWFLEVFEKTLKAAGVPEGTPHDLRHSFARHLAEVAPINVVQAALGHKNLATTQRYTRLSAEQAKPHMERFSLGQQPEAKPEQPEA